MEMVTSYNTSYGKGGKPFTVRITLSSGLETAESYWTESEAWEARDRALDAGFVFVRIEGLPTRGYATCGEPETLPSLVILE